MAKRRISSADALKKLKMQWVVFLFVGTSIIAVLRVTFVQPSWFVVAAFVFLTQAVILYFDLSKNHSKKQSEIIPGFGLGTWLSLLRLLLLSLLSGLLFASRPQGQLAWVPFDIYLAFNLIDLIDGYAARRGGHVTALGEKLDLDLDGRGMLVGALLAVQFGTAGWWYAFVGLARYIYLAALWTRKRLGLRVREQPNPNSRTLAGLQMGIGTALLAPVLHPPFMILISTLTMVVFLANFFYDWLVAIKRAPAVKKPWLPESARGVLGFALRILIFTILVMRAASGTNTEPAFVEVTLGAILLSGIGARVFSLILLTWLGISLRAYALDSIALITSLANLSLVYTGAGWLTLWAPENVLIRKRLGDRKPA